MAVGPADISHLRVKENHIKSAREVEASISTIIRRLLHKYLPMQPDEVLVQNAEATATSNPTCYYLSFLPFPPYIFFYTGVPPPPAEQAWHGREECIQVCGKRTVEPRSKITSRLRLRTLLFSRYPKVQCIGIGLRVVEDCGVQLLQGIIVHHLKKVCKFGWS